MSSLTLTARWLFPADRPPLERGTITIAGDRIVAVEPHGVRTADTDLGNAAILPGFVNAHTHLDLSGLRGKCPPTPEFTDWLRAVIRHRRNTTPEQTEADIRAGLEESLRFGTTLLGDIAGQGRSWEFLTQAELRAMVFYELLGLTEERATEAGQSAVRWMRAAPETPLCRKAYSPHAPYSVRFSLFKSCTDPKDNLAIHFAESAEELELINSKTGPFVDFLSSLGVWDPSGLAPHLASFLTWSRLAANALFIHCNYMPVDWCKYIAGLHTIVYCPRTHAAFGHPPHPFREFLARGVRVALGTDSLASNPDLDLWAEACFVHQRHPDVSGETLLRMATLSGAEALGWADETGSLTPGKSADLVVLLLPDEEPDNPFELILRAPLAAERKTMFRGEWRRFRDASLD